MDAEALRHWCVEQIDTYTGGYFHDRPWLREAFLSVPREHFTPARCWNPHSKDEADRYRLLDRIRDEGEWLEAVYEPRTPLITQIADGAITPDDGPTQSNDFTSSISCSAVVVNMLHHLDPQPGERILEIGTGTGYSTALLAHRVGAANVVTVEIDSTLAQMAEARLRDLGLNPRLMTGDGELGHPDGAPFDRIISTACVYRIPPAWLGQLKEGGILLTPMATPLGNSDALVRLIADGRGGATGRLITAVNFMRLRSQREHPPWKELGWPRLPDFGVFANQSTQTVHEERHW